MKIPMLLRPARAAQRLEAREVYRITPSARVGNRFSAPQIVWNKSNRCTGERGGARVGRPRWAGPLPPNAPPPPSLRVFGRRASKLLGWLVRGLNRPTPFFDDRTKAPRAVPRVVPKEAGTGP